MKINLLAISRTNKILSLEPLPRNLKIHPEINKIAEAYKDSMIPNIKGLKELANKNEDLVIKLEPLEIALHSRYPKAVNIIRRKMFKLIIGRQGVKGIIDNFLPRLDFVGRKKVKADVDIVKETKKHINRIRKNLEKPVKESIERKNGVHVNM